MAINRTLILNDHQWSYSDSSQTGSEAWREVLRPLSDNCAITTKEESVFHWWNPSNDEHQVSLFPKYNQNVHYLLNKHSIFTFL